MDFTTLTNLSVTGQLTADKVTCKNLSNALMTKVFTDTAALTEGDREAILLVTQGLSGAAVLTIGDAGGKLYILYNADASYAVTVKNLAADTGTSVGAGKVALVYTSAAKDGTKAVILN